MFIRPMWESRSLAIFIIMFSVVREVSPFASTHSEPLRAAVLDSTHSMCRLESLGPSLTLKLSVTDLWTLLWSIMFIRPMWESCSLAIFIIMFSVVREVSPFASTHSEPLRAAVLDSTHSMRQLEIQDEVQF
jgi:hypothetical protein